MLAFQSIKAIVLFCCAVMKSMNSRQDYWQGDRTGAELKIRTLQEELEKMTLEKSRVLLRSVVSERRTEQLGGQERLGRSTQTDSRPSKGFCGSNGRDGREKCSSVKINLSEETENWRKRRRQKGSLGSNPSL